MLKFYEEFEQLTYRLDIGGATGGEQEDPGPPIRSGTGSGISAKPLSSLRARGT